jgi:hypothetical protein
MIGPLVDAHASNNLTFFPYCRLAASYLCGVNGETANPSASPTPSHPTAQTSKYVQAINHHYTKCLNYTYFWDLTTHLLGPSKWLPAWSLYFAKNTSHKPPE